MKLLKNKFFIKFRNYFNLKPIKIFTEGIPIKSAVSDFFPWRLDDGFETYFDFQITLYITLTVLLMLKFMCLIKWQINSYKSKK